MKFSKGITFDWSKAGPNEAKCDVGPNILIEFSRSVLQVVVDVMQMQRNVCGNRDRSFCPSVS